MSPNESEKRNRVAVVAIHGVGDHPQFQTAREIGDLLQDLDEKHCEPRYVPFKERTLRLNVRPVKVTPPDHADDPSRWGPLDSMARAAVRDKAMILESSAEHSTDTVDHKFMASQLAGYKGEKPENTYETIRLEGSRTPAEGPKQDVDVYEMYWSDLTKTGNAFTSIFGELYELLFHLGSLGTQTVGAALAHFKNKQWSRFNRVQMWAASVLALPLPILNLFMLALTGVVIVTSLLSKVSTWHEFAIAETVTCVVLAIVIGIKRSRAGRLGFGPFVMPLSLLGAALALAVVGKLNADYLNPEWVECGFAIVLTAIFGFLVASVVGAYDRNRPGAKKMAGWALLAFVVAVAVAGLLGRLSCLRATSHISIVASVNAIEIANVLAQLCWGGFLFLTLAAHVCGALALGSVDAAADSENRSRAKRSRWTARLMLAVPSFAYITITLTFWAGLLALCRTILPNARDTAAALQYTSVITGTTDPIGDWAAKAIRWAGTQSFPLLAVLAAAALIPMIWGLFPAILAEMKPPAEKKETANSDAAGGLGDWLSHGYRFMWVSGQLLYWGMALVVPVVFVMNFWLLFPGHHMDEHWRDMGLKVTEWLGGLLVVAGAGLFAARGKLEKMALGFRPLLRTMLDVDNWFREHPRDANPRARICGRYASLLRYVAREENGYQAIVIVAHSQGTIITADLLRFINAEAAESGGMAKYDPDLARLGGKDLPVYFFSMGCPLRQFYGLRFPYLYQWARFETTGAGERLNDVPALEPLGARQWVNAYRSGDYIGRNLWRPDQSGKIWQPGLMSRDEKGSRQEVCIGPGAHTHYWDSTAKAIAIQLDQLIAERALIGKPATP